MLPPCSLTPLSLLALRRTTIRPMPKMTHGDGEGRLHVFCGAAPGSDDHRAWVAGVPNTAIAWKYSFYVGVFVRDLFETTCWKNRPMNRPSPRQYLERESYRRSCFRTHSL